MVLPTLYTNKKTFYYNFFPTKKEAEFLNTQKATDGATTPVGRTLVEIRDIYPPPVLDPNNPWVIKKTLNQQEAALGMLVLSLHDTFEHVLRYWTFEMANYLAIGQRVGVTLWDVTEERNPKKYQSNEVFLQLVANDESILSCMELVKYRKLKPDDDIHIYWDSKESCFKSRLVL